jgi:hypothetical protein
MRVPVLIILALACLISYQTRPVPEITYLLKPAYVFDGEASQLHDHWVVLVQGEKIVAAGPAGEVTVPANAKVIELPQQTLLPGLIEAHSHILLHPYSETPWNDQVAHESLSLRSHAQRTICEVRCWPDSRRFAIWERKAPRTPTLVSSRRCSRESFLVQECS